MNPDKKENNKILIWSIIFSIIVIIAALTIGFLTHSQVILFDGIFTLVGLILSYISLLTMKFIKKKDLKNYPFGKEPFEPFLVVCQYCIILVISITNIIDAIQVIAEGGREMNLKAGVIYGIFSAVFCLAAYLYLKFYVKQSPTAIEEVEIEQWKFSLLYSLAMLIGFSFAFLLSRTSWVKYVIYVDPVLAFSITVVFIKTSVLRIRNSVKEISLAVPSQELTALVTEKVNHISREYSYTDMVLRVGKVGGQLIVEIDYIIEENSKIDSIIAQDQLRGKLTKSLSELPYDKWLNVNFVGDIKWAE